MGGEANYLFEYSPSSPHKLAPVPRTQWLTPEMASWSDADITRLLDVAESALRDCVNNLNLPAMIMRKDRAVGIIPKEPGTRIARESLEETVLIVQRILELSSLGSSEERPTKHRPSSPPIPPSVASQSRRVPFCAFNGGNEPCGTKKASHGHNIGSQRCFISWLSALVIGATFSNSRVTVKMQMRGACWGK